MGAGADPDADSLMQEGAKCPEAAHQVCAFGKTHVH